METQTVPSFKEIFVNKVIIAKGSKILLFFSDFFFLAKIVLAENILNTEK